MYYGPLGATELKAVRKSVVPLPRFKQIYAKWLCYMMGMMRSRWIFNVLYGTAFVSVDGLDDDTEWAALQVRRDFAEETGYSYEGMPVEWSLEYARSIGWEPRVAEALVALACSFDYRDGFNMCNDNDYAPRLIWMMLGNMGIHERLSDVGVDLDVIRKPIQRWMRRAITRYGRGGPFPVKPNKAYPDFRRIRLTDMQAIYAEEMRGSEWVGPCFTYPVTDR